MQLISNISNNKFPGIFRCFVRVTFSGSLGDAAILLQSVAPATRYDCQECRWHSRHVPCVTTSSSNTWQLSATALTCSTFHWDPYCPPTWPQNCQASALFAQIHKVGPNNTFCELHRESLLGVILCVQLDETVRIYEVTDIGPQHFVKQQK